MVVMGLGVCGFVGRWVCVYFVCVCVCVWEGGGSVGTMTTGRTKPCVSPACQPASQAFTASREYLFAAARTFTAKLPSLAVTGACHCCCRYQDRGLPFCYVGYFDGMEEGVLRANIIEAKVNNVSVR